MYINSMTLKGYDENQKSSWPISLQWELILTISILRLLPSQFSKYTYAFMKSRNRGISVP